MNWLQGLLNGRKQVAAKKKTIRLQDLQPGQLVCVELNRDLIRGISLTTEEGIASKLPDDIKFIRGFVKRINQVKPQGNAIGQINVLELLTAIRLDSRNDCATRLEICILEHETKSIRTIDVDN